MFTLSRINRFPADMQTTVGRLNRLMDEAFRTWPQTDGDPLTGAWLPAVDVIEDSDAVRIVAELPGVKPEDVKIQMGNNVLTIRGEKLQERGEAETLQRWERTYGAFERSFTVPSTVDAEQIRATSEHGVLTVTLPKVERAKPRAISIEVKQG